MSKEYEIKSIQDIIDCTNAENLDRFLIDFKYILSKIHEVRELSPEGVLLNGFSWIDDGKHIGEMNLKHDFKGG